MAQNPQIPIGLLNLDVEAGFMAVGIQQRFPDLRGVCAVMDWTDISKSL